MHDGMKNMREGLKKDKTVRRGTNSVTIVKGDEHRFFHVSMRVHQGQIPLKPELFRADPHYQKMVEFVEITFRDPNGMSTKARL